MQPIRARVIWSKLRKQSESVLYGQNGIINYGFDIYLPELFMKWNKLLHFGIANKLLKDAIA